jgi:DNA-directed RNA polymerase subunit alpha
MIGPPRPDELLALSDQLRQVCASSGTLIAERKNWSPSTPPGEGSMKPPVSPAMILQIKEMAARGGHTRDIARHLGLSISTIHKVRQGYYDHRLKRPAPGEDDERQAMIAAWCARCRCHVYPPCQACRLREYQRRRMRHPEPSRQPSPLPKISDPRINQQLQLSTAEIGLPLRVVNYLQQRQLFTVNDLLHCRREELLRIPNFAGKTLEQVYRCLARLGFSRRSEHGKPPPRHPGERLDSDGRRV